MLGGLMLGGPILVGSRGPALIMAACAASATSKAGTTATQASRYARALSQLGRSKDFREGRPESLRIALPPIIRASSSPPLPGHAAHPPSRFELGRAGAEHPALRVGAAGARRLSGNGSDHRIARFREQ
jgi:hypothetical protein